MIDCLKCGNKYDTLACPVCVQRASDAAMVAYQRNYLRGVAAGNTELRVARMRNHEQHVELFNFEKQAFCGLDLSEHVQRRYRLPYTSDMMRDICAQCRERVRREIAKVTE